MGYEVYETDAFTDICSALDADELNWIRKMIAQLKVNAYVGKPLKFDWFREKKYGGKRLYYLVYAKSNRVLLVAFGGKKEQQKIISHVLQNLERYNMIVEQL